MMKHAGSFLGFIVLLTGWTAFPLYAAQRWGGAVAWAASLLAMTVFIMAVGFNIRNDYKGAVTDEWGRISLSRLQMLAWTLLIISAYQTAVILNILAGLADPLAIAIPEEMWFVLGISTASLLGTPLITTSKVRKRQALMPPSKSGQDAPRRTKPAAWSDLFTGVDKASEDFVDISRVQMFFFTFIALLAYGYSVASMFLQYSRGGDPSLGIKEFPAISSGLLALLGISHTAYLGNKAIDSAPQNPPKPPEDHPNG